jgi:hypothetical protein
MAFWDFIASGGSTDLLGQLGEIAGRSYLEGFESTIGELPNVAARAMTDTEKALQASIGSTATKLLEEYESKFSARKIKLGVDVEGDLADQLNLELGKGVAGKSKGAADLSAKESRLLSRGPGSKLSLEDGINELVKLMRKNNTAIEDQSAIQAGLESAARETQTAIENKGNLMFASPPA